MYHTPVARRPPLEACRGGANVLPLFPRRRRTTDDGHCGRPLFARLLRSQRLRHARLQCPCVILSATRAPLAVGKMSKMNQTQTRTAPLRGALQSLLPPTSDDAATPTPPITWVLDGARAQTHTPLAPSTRRGAPANARAWRSLKMGLAGGKLARAQCRRSLPTGRGPCTLPPFSLYILLALSLYLEYSQRYHDCNDAGRITRSGNAPRATGARPRHVCRAAVVVVRHWT